ncbi:energy transducer TonB [Lewinella sp. 4G2]|uniref:energy transducer TonB n=1 Tax=Lewinella sp. 4G2 TaxID=1803372 RepID=UPI0007B4C02D|nr:energy transducer TonB [Lewinella sp. 4G2]OAV46197.1 hypothetical protein A3850_018240 [Lewinella sp. 4G2]
MSKSNRPTHVSKPVYPGGVKAMRKFVSANLKYPKEALKNKVEGTVTIRYSLDYRGKVVAAKVKSGLGHGCDAEAIRVVEMLQFNVPQASKKKVRIHQDIQIHFKLPKTKTIKGNIKPTQPTAAATGTKVVYTTAKKSSQQKGSTSNGYSYTINW